MREPSPKFYFYNRFESDRDFVLNQMRYIPADKKQEVSDTFDNIMLSKQIPITQRRYQAKKYLTDLAKMYYKERTPEALDRHREEMKRMEQEAKKKAPAYNGPSIIDMAEGKKK